MTATLSRTTALVLGAAGLGTPALLALAGAGVGRLVVVDGAVLEVPDLGGQPLFGEQDLGERRALAAARRLRALFPATEVVPVERPLDAAAAQELARSADLVVDGSDEIATQFLACDAAVAAGKPLVHGGVIRFAAQILTVLPGRTGCLRCLFEAPPPPREFPTCAEAGVLGPLAGFAGGLMGAEAVRVLSGAPAWYAGRLLVYESRTARSRTIPVPVREGCPACRGAGAGRAEAVSERRPSQERRA